MSQEYYKANVIIDDNGCWLWQGSLIGKGYGPHRKSYTAFKGKIPEGKIIRHTCDVPRCINPDHLIPGTYHDNMQDCIERGRYRNGTCGAPTTYSDEVIAEVRQMAEEGYNCQEIADAFGMSKGYAWKIIHYQFRKEIA